MALWVDKYRPGKLSELSFHKEQAGMLRRLVESGDFPHLLVSGPPGAGKKTRVSAVLRELFGPGVTRVRMEHKAFKTPSNKTLEIATVASTHHIEINPSDVGVQDRLVVQEVIKEMASMPLPNVDAANYRPFKGTVFQRASR